MSANKTKSAGDKFLHVAQNNCHIECNSCRTRIKCSKAFTMSTSELCISPQIVISEPSHMDRNFKTLKAI